jgi:hypothetical protein
MVRMLELSAKARGDAGGLFVTLDEDGSVSAMMVNNQGIV